jgi:hypothetical protein
MTSAAQLSARRTRTVAEPLETILIGHTLTAWPGVRRAGLPRQRPPLTPDQWHRYTAPP